jgi:hypothetical protein
MGVVPSDAAEILSDAKQPRAIPFAGPLHNKDVAGRPLSAPKTFRSMTCV